MKQKLLTIKSLLVAVLLLGGANFAWAGEVSTIYTKALSGWSSDDLTASSSTFTASKWTPSQTGDANKGLWTSTTTGLMTRCRQNTVTGTLTLNRTAYTIVTLDAVWNVGDNDCNGGGHTNGYSQYNYFQYGDLLIATCLDNRSSDYSYTINGVKTNFSNVTAGCLLNTDLTIHIVVNSLTGEISEFYIKNGETFLAQFSDLGATNNTFAESADYDKVITTAYTNVSRTNAFNYLKSITVQQETQDIPTASVTFKYEDTDGNSLSAYKADQVASVAIGTTISTLISTYNATFYNGEDNKYVYNTYTVTDDYTTVQAGGNTVTLKFTDYPATDYSVIAQASGSDVKTLVSGTAFLDGSTTRYWSKYINESDQWYIADEATYGTSITATTTNVAFTTTDAISHFFEAENMTASRTYGTISNNTNYSNGAGSGIYQDATLTTTTTIPSGTYTISIGSVTRNASKAQSYKISYSTDGSIYTDTGKSISFTTAAGSSEQSVTEVSIPASAYIRLTEGTGGNASDYIDYVIAKRTGDATISVTVTAASYATYVSDYDLDFSASDIKAYKVKVTAKGVATMTQVDNVPAGTPVLLYKDGGATEDIPVMTGAAAVSDNDLVAGTGAAVATTDGAGNTNMILNNVGGNIGFYFANGQTVAANRAYLHFDSSLAPDALAPMMLVFDNETTGINEVKGSEFTVNGYYDLQGRQVAKPAKGLYIVNGKKVVIK